MYKLVRDNIPEIIMADNRNPVTRILTLDEAMNLYEKAGRDDLVKQITRN